MCPKPALFILPDLRGLWRRKRSQSPLLLYPVLSEHRRQNIQVGRGQSARPPPPCRVGPEMEKREATAPRAAPPPNTEKERTRDAAHVMARCVCKSGAGCFFLSV